MKLKTITPLSKNKKGVIGKFLSFISTTIGIIILLLIFVVISGLFRIFIDTELRVYDESDTGIADTVRYMEGDYKDLATIRYLHQQKTTSINDLIKEVGYKDGT